MTEIDQIIDDFCMRGWEAEPYERLHPLFTASPPNAREIVLAGIERVPKRATFHDDALSYFGEAEWPEIVNDALRSFSHNPNNQSAEAVIECDGCRISGHLWQFT